MNTAGGTISRGEASDEKRGMVLESAMGVFLNYGFSRTTMDDLARAAGMSRPALYLLFKNKRDIFRAVSMQTLEQTLIATREELASPGDIASRLSRAAYIGIIEPYCKVMTAPHGAELFDGKDGLLDDVISKWHADFATIISEAIRSETVGVGSHLADRGLTPDGLAQMLLDGIEGAKKRETREAELMKSVNQLTSVIGMFVSAR